MLTSDENACDTITKLRRMHTKMSFTLCAELVVLLMSEVVASQVFLCKEASLSCPVITYSHRRLKGFTFKTIHFASLVSCGLLCQRDPRCVSTNFRKVFKSEGTCELNDRGALLTEKGNELEYDEEAIYTQFYDTKVTKKILIKDQEEGVIDSWYLSHKIFIFRRKMWKLSICHIFLWMFLSFGPKLVWRVCG